MSGLAVHQTQKLFYSLIPSAPIPYPLQLPNTPDNNKVNPNPLKLTTVSTIDQVPSVPFTSSLNSEFTSQNPESFTCDSISDPHPVAITSISGRTFMCPAIGASTPEATAIATVDEPMHTRTTAASAQASTSGGICAPIASPTVDCAAPESRKPHSTRPPPTKSQTLPQSAQTSPPSASATYPAP